VQCNNILIYIQQDATLHSLFYLETALYVSGGTITHHQERKQLYLQHLVFVTPLSWKSWNWFECAVGGVRHPQHISWPLKMWPLDCPETSVRNYHSTLRNIPEERRSHLHRGGSLKSRIVIHAFGKENWIFALVLFFCALVQYSAVGEIVRSFIVLFLCN